MSESKWVEPRPLSIVRLTRDCDGIYDDLYEAKDFPLIYLGEIPNMESHSVILCSSGRILSGMHSDSFEEIPEDDDSNDIYGGWRLTKSGVGT